MRSARRGPPLGDLRRHHRPHDHLGRPVGEHAACHHRHLRRRHSRCRRCHGHTFDRALGEPGELGRRIARNTQIVLQEESSLGRIADPVAGSYYGEALTDEVAPSSAWQHPKSIESEGGALVALRSGLIVNAVAEEADRREYDLVHRVRLMTGINEFPLLGDDGSTGTEPADTTALAKLDVARLAERPAISSLAGPADAAPGERLKQATAAATAGARIDEIFSAFAGETYSQPKLEVRPDSLPIEACATRSRIKDRRRSVDAPRIFSAPAPARSPRMWHSPTGPRASSRSVASRPFRAATCPTTRPRPRPSATVASPPPASAPAARRHRMRHRRPRRCPACCRCRVHLPAQTVSRAGRSRRSRRVGPRRSPDG